MSQDLTENRRQEQRMPLEGLTLQVKKLGISHRLENFQTCHSVDLSYNGLAFTSENLELKIPEKIEFILTIDSHVSKGIAVTCNVKQETDNMRYGLMFLSVSPEISSIINFVEISTQELHNLADKQAEKFIFSLINKQDPQNHYLISRQQQIYDACRYYLLRLGEMGARMNEKHSEKLIHPVQAVRLFRDREHHLILKWYSLADQQHREIIIAITNNSNGFLYLINESLEAESPVKVLEALGNDLFKDLYLI